MFADKVVANGIKLHLGTTLGEVNIEVVRDVEHLSNAGLCAL